MPQSGLDPLSQLTHINPLGAIPVKNVESMSLPELKALSAKVADAIAKAKIREKAALKEEMIALASSRGLTIGDVLGAPQKAPRATILTKWRDKKTGATWSGRGRYPQGFEKSRAEQVR